MTNVFSTLDKKKDHQGNTLNVIILVWTVVVSMIVALGFIFLPQFWIRWTACLGISVVIGVFNFTLNRLGYTRLASKSLTVMLWLFITIPCYSAGGIMAPGILSQMSVILTASILLGWRGGAAICLLTVGADFWLAYMEANGNLPAPSVIHNPITRWLAAIIPFGTILVLQYYATKHLHLSLADLKHEVAKREEAEKITNQTMFNLKERVKELKTLHGVSSILQDEEAPLKTLFGEIAEILPAGWQYPDITAARVFFSGTECTTANYKPSAYSQRAEVKTESGSTLCIEVVYLQQVPELDEGPFLHEERNLIDMLAEIIKMNLDRRERKAELKDYKYALDVGYMVAISGADERFTYVNDNFCRSSKYSQAELLGKDFSVIASVFQSPEYFKGLNMTLQNGKPFMGEFCNKAKDGTLYWVDTTVVPFLDENGKVYQYLAINHDITERKEAEDKIKQNEQLLKKITGQIPGNTYMFEIDESGKNKILFMSRGKDTINHQFDIKELSENPDRLNEIVHLDDKGKFNDAMKEAYKMQSSLSVQYRALMDGNIRWRWLQAIPEKDNNGKILWYGVASDITSLVDYVASIEQILFDIGHVIRRPVSTMLGMSKLIIDGNLSEKEIREISQKLYLISEEMDKFINELNQAYQQKKQNTQHNIDISSTIDKRSSLFS